MSSRTYHRDDTHEDISNDSAPFDGVPKFRLYDPLCFGGAVWSHESVECGERSSETYLVSLTSQIPDTFERDSKKDIPVDERNEPPILPPKLSQSRGTSHIPGQLSHVRGVIYPVLNPRSWRMEEMIRLWGRGCGNLA